MERRSIQSDAKADIRQASWANISMKSLQDTNSGALTHIASIKRRSKLRTL
jgi:hypothetical protein